MVRERGEGGNLRQAWPREARAPGRWKRAAGYLIARWLATFQNDGMPTATSIADAEHYLDSGDFSMKFITDHYGFEVNDFGGYTNPQWEMIRTHFVRMVFSFDEWQEISPEVLKAYFMEHPPQTKISEPETTAEKATAPEEKVTPKTETAPPKPKQDVPSESGWCAVRHKFGPVYWVHPEGAAFDELRCAEHKETTT